eukprot:21456_1
MSILSCSNANIVLQYITPAALSLQSHHPLVGSAVLKEFARGVYLKTMSADSADEQPLMGMRRRHVSQGERIPTPAFTLLSTCSLPMPPTQSNHKSSLSKQLLIDQSSTRQTNVKPDPTTDPNDQSNPKSCSSEQVTIHACYRWSPCQTVIYGAAVDSTGRHISCDVVEKDYRNRPESRSVIMSKWWETIVQPVINRATHGRRPSETVVNVVLVNLGEVDVKDVEEWESSLIDIGILHSPAHKYSMSRADTQEGLPGIQLRPSATRDPSSRLSPLRPNITLARSEPVSPLEAGSSHSEFRRRGHSQSPLKSARSVWSGRVHVYLMSVTPDDQHIRCVVGREQSNSSPRSSNDSSWSFHSLTANDSAFLALRSARAHSSQPHARAHPTIPLR